MDFEDLTLLVRYGQLVIDKNNLIVGFAILNSSSTVLTVEALYPQSNYTFCVYLEGSYRIPSDPSCLNLTTGDWQLFTKMSFTFSVSTNLNQINQLLCSMVIKSNTRASNIVQSNGFTCSTGTQPLKSYLPYGGPEYSNYDANTNFYLIPDPLIENDLAISTVESFYVKNKMDPSNLLDLQNKYSIDFLDGATLPFQFSYSQAIYSLSPMNIA